MSLIYPKNVPARLRNHTELITFTGFAVGCVTNLLATTPGAIINTHGRVSCVHTDATLRFQRRKVMNILFSFNPQYLPLYSFSSHLYSLHPSFQLISFFPSIPSFPNPVLIFPLLEIVIIMMHELMQAFERNHCSQ